MKKHQWERRDEESEEAFAAFLVYRDMGVKRSARGAAHVAQGRTPGGQDDRRPEIFGRWCSAHDWVDRARAYDDHKFREIETSTMRSRIKMLDEYNASVARVIEKGMKRLEELLSIPTTRQRIEREIEVAGQKVAQTIIIEPVRWKPSDAAALLSAMDKAARLSLGDATERADISGTITVDKLNDIRADLERRLAASASESVASAADSVH